MQIDWKMLAAAHPELSGLPAILCAGAAEIAFAAGEVLGRRGTRPRRMFYLLDGEIRLVRHTLAGDPVILQRSRRGFVAEASLEAARYHCDLAAFEAGRLLAFPRADFRRALDDDPAFRRAWASGLAAEIRRLRAQNERLHLRKADERVLHYLESEGQDGAVALTQSRKAWAAELGLSHEALYRTLRRMADDGRLELGATRIALRRQGAPTRR